MICFIKICTKDIKFVKLSASLSAVLGLKYKTKSFL